MGTYEEKRYVEKGHYAFSSNVYEIKNYQSLTNVWLVKISFEIRLCYLNKLNLNIIWSSLYFQTKLKQVTTRFDKLILYVKIKQLEFGSLTARLKSAWPLNIQIKFDHIIKAF